MKKTPSKKLSLTTQTIRNLTSDQLGSVNGGSRLINTSTDVQTIGTSGTSVISRNPSGGSIGNPSGGLPSGGSIVGH